MRFFDPPILGSLYAGTTLYVRAHNMALERDRLSFMSKSFIEGLHGGYFQGFNLTGDKIVDERSEFQHIQIFDTPDNGRIMVLDDIVQITTRDEDSYSEMLTHVPMFEHGAVKNVAIVGGGDLAVAEEALKHPSLQSVDLAEIDGRVVDLCREHFADINASAFADNRLNIHIRDAAEFLKEPAQKGKYDLIVSDRPDPVGPAEVLFSDQFYSTIGDALSPTGIAVFQTGAPFFQADELRDTCRQLRDVFKYSGVYLTVTPTYTGGFMALTWASNGFNLGQDETLAKVPARVAEAGLKTTYYNADMHRAAYALPNWIKDIIA